MSVTSTANFPAGAGITAPLPSASAAPHGSISYSDLISHHLAGLERRFRAEGFTEDKARQVKGNHLTAIREWIRQKGLVEGSLVGSEFDRGYTTELERHVTYLKSKPHRHKGQIIRGLSNRTICNRASILGQWRDSWRAKAGHGGARINGKAPGTFTEIIRALVKRSGLTPGGFTRAAGVSHLRFYRWYTGLYLPSDRPGVFEYLEQIKRYAGLRGGELTSHIVRWRRRSLRKSAEAPRSKYGERQRKCSAETYRLRVFPSGLKAEFDGWVAMMTSPLEPETPLARNGFWFVDPETGECPTGLRCKFALSSFFGYLCLPAEGRHFAIPEGRGNAEVKYTVVKGEGFDEGGLTLALLTDTSLVRQHLEFLRERAGGFYNGETEHFLNLCCALLRKETGYVRQHPEYGARLLPPVLAADWDERCDSAHQRFRRILRELKKNGLIVQSRDVEEPIDFILNDPHPMRYLYELADLMEGDLPGPHCLHARALAYRDMFLVRFLTANPLRIKHFSRMTWRADNTGNLYQERNGSWWLRFPKDVFKNRRSLKKNKLIKKYRSPLPPSLWPYVETYLWEHRPHLLGADASDYVFRPAKIGGSVTLGTAGTKPMAPGSLSGLVRDCARVYLRCMGFGPHAYRHILATDFLKNKPGGIMIAASILHDSPEMILKYYGHLQHADYFRHWIDYHEEQLGVRRAAQRKGGDGQ